MTNPETKTQYEGAILNQLVRNAEKLAVVETNVTQNTEKLGIVDQRLNKIDQKLNKIDQRLDVIENRLSRIELIIEKIESLLGWLRWIGGGLVAIALSLMANFVYSYLS